MASTAAHQRGTLCGDVPARTTVWTVRGGQPGPLEPADGETMHVCDLGAATPRPGWGPHRAAVGSPEACVPAELVGDHDAEPGFVCIQGVDELQHEITRCT